MVYARKILTIEKLDRCQIFKEIFRPLTAVKFPELSRYLLLKDFVSCQAIQIFALIESLTAVKFLIKFHILTLIEPLTDLSIIS